MRKIIGTSSSPISLASQQNYRIWCARHYKLSPAALKCTLAACAVLLALGIVLAIVGSRYLPDPSLNAQGHEMLYAAGWLGAVGLGGLLLAASLKYSCNVVDKYIRQDAGMRRLLEHGRVVTVEEQTKFESEAASFGEQVREKVHVVPTEQNANHDLYYFPNVLKIQEEHPNQQLKDMIAILPTARDVFASLADQQDFAESQFCSSLYDNMKICYKYICCDLEDLEERQKSMQDRERTNMWKEVEKQLVSTTSFSFLQEAAFILFKSYACLTKTMLVTEGKLSLSNSNKMPSKAYLDLFITEGTIQNNMKKLCVAAVGVLGQHFDRKTIEEIVGDNVLLTLANPTTA